MVKLQEYIPYIAAVGGTILLLSISERKHREGHKKEVPEIPTPPSEKKNFIEGYVRDNNVKLGIKGALVKYGGKSTTTDCNGHFMIENVPTSGYLTVTASGYEPYKKYITVPEYGGKRIDIYLTSKAGYGGVYFSSYPTGASIYVDGNYISTTPFSAVLPVGNHNVQFSKTGYAPAIKDVYVAPSPMITKIHALLGAYESTVVVRYESIKPPEKKKKPEGIELIDGVYLTRLCYKTVTGGGIYFLATIRNNSGKDVTLHRIWFEGYSYRLDGAILGGVGSTFVFNKIMRAGQEMDFNFYDNYPPSRFENGAVIKDIKIGFEFYTPKLASRVVEIKQCIKVPSKGCLM